MSRKYHINKKGAPDICRAKNGNCPFGGDNSHYESREEAQKAADELNEKNHGLLQELNSNVLPADSHERKIELAIRIQVLQDKEENTAERTYFARCERSEKLENYVPTSGETYHYSAERAAKDKIITDNVGEGELLGHYKVHHEIKDGEMGDQIIGVYDNGQIKIYDADHGSLVTTFVPHKTRMEVILVKAGEIPNNEWLNQVQKNKELTDAKWAKVKHLYKKPKYGKPKGSKETTQKPKTTNVSTPKSPAQEQTRKNTRNPSKKPQSKSFKQDIVSEFMRKNKTRGRKRR